jgi:hypothetical protein
LIYTHFKGSGNEILKQFVQNKKKLKEKQNDKNELPLFFVAN